METQEITQQESMMKLPEPQKEHEWLHQLVGAWKLESQEMGECPAAPSLTGDRHHDQSAPPPGHWTETGRSLGGIWVLVEGQGEMGGAAGASLMTLGYDPERKRFVGSWVGSMMTHFWVYDGTLDGNVLTLESDGPDFVTPGKMGKYRDVIELVSPDLRTLTSHALGEDGEWKQFMTARYRRTA